MILSIIGFIISIGIVIFVHEFGHYYVAKRLGVKILEFSIGFGKSIYSTIDKHGVKWTIGIIPLGGFVKMHGDTSPVSIKNQTVEHEELAFNTKPPYIRFLIVLAGPLANYLLTIAILSTVYFFAGKIHIPPIINEIVKDSPAEKAGLLPDDKIVSVNDTEINDFGQLQRIILFNTQELILLQIERAGKLITLSATTGLKSYDQNAPHKRVGYLGIISKQEPKIISMGLFSSVKQSIIEVINISQMILKTLGQMITGDRSTSELAGPFAIARESGESLSGGVLSFAAFVAMISINIGFINLLPIPILDGGHLVLIMYEVLAQKRLSDYYQTIFIKIGALIILFLIVISISNDIKNIIF